MEIKILGAMTGTSCDGLDAACLSFRSESQFHVLWERSVAYPSSLRKRVLDAQKPGTRMRLKEVLALEADLGDWYGSTFQKMLRTHGAVHVIANHGQTLSHFPDIGMTLQAGNAARIAQLTGTTVISRFRDGDMAAGGQGAPLLPLYHRVVASQLASKPVGLAIHNIGGISNLTYLGPRGKVLAFDTGPGNAWMDASAQLATRGRLTMDRGGELALQGTPDLRAVEKILKLPFFRKAPPKSTGRDDFPFELLRKATRSRGPDLVATATAVTVESIARAYERWILKRGWPLHSLFVVGGGAQNTYLLESLRYRLSGTEVMSLAEAGVDPQTIESQGFAYFGYLTLLGKPIGGEWTGCRGFAPPGQITPGSNWRSLAQLLTQRP